MKTTIQRLFAISILALTCFSSTDVLASCLKSISCKVIETERSIKANPLEGNLIFSECSKSEAQKEAQLVMKQIVDIEESKVIRKIMSENQLVIEVGNTSVDLLEETLDFRTEAQLETKRLADNAEASAIRRLMADGKWLSCN